MLPPFAAADGGKPQAFLSHGFISMNVLKKGSPDRIRELLRIMNFLAAPFGSQEDLLLSYGLKDQDYSPGCEGQPGSECRRHSSCALCAVAIHRRSTPG